MGCGQGCDAPLTEAALLERGIERYVKVWREPLERMGIHSAAELRAKFSDCCSIKRESVFENGKTRYLDWWAVFVSHNDKTTFAAAFDRCGNHYN